jgi:tetraacyldisaccharide 4'-kinase
MSKAPPGPRWFQSVAPLLVPGYRLAVALRNRRYSAGTGVQRLPVPVISVGNLTAGGTGKTPMVALLIEMLREAGFHPVIGMRGYKARPGEHCDEQLEYAQRIPGVPVVAHPRRFEALSRFLAEQPSRDCVVLDDGFQHRQLHRDLDLVLVDASADTLNQRILPAGYLREPLKALRRADGIIITRADDVDDTLAREIEAIAGHSPLAWTNHIWRLLTIYTARHPAGSTEPIEWLDGKRVVTMLGIGNPAPMRRQVKATGALPLDDIPVQDHQAYADELVESARRRSTDAAALIVTAKDWVKLAPMIDLHQWHTPIVVPQLRLDVLAGEQALADRVIQAARTPVAMQDDASAD